MSGEAVTSFQYVSVLLSSPSPPWSSTGTVSRGWLDFAGASTVGTRRGVGGSAHRRLRVLPPIS